MVMLTKRKIQIIDAAINISVIFWLSVISFKKMRPINKVKIKMLMHQEEFLNKGFDLKL